MTDDDNKHNMDERKEQMWKSCWINCIKYVCIDDVAIFEDHDVVKRKKKVEKIIRNKWMEEIDRND